MSVSALGEALSRMHRNGLRGGLPASQAAALTEALSSGSALSDAASRAGLDRRLSEAVATAGVPDVPAALLEQVYIAESLESGSRRLRAAGTYPLVLAVALLSAALVITTQLTPAFEGMSFAPPSSRPLLVSVGGSVLCLILLSVLVLGRVRIPFFSGGWRALHRTAFLSSLNALLSGGAPLPAAVRASSVWCLPAQRRAAVLLSQSLEAGRAPPEVGALLSPAESALLHQGAETGTASASAHALAAQQRVRLERVLPDAMLRIHIISLLLAGIGVLVVGVSFFQVYFNVLSI